ncbi:MAG TPA: tRNA (adenosine(37)-N6)-threonylcarbamoyltransferase complex ATPase subunit type 1 TsaE [Candidatus Saccharimonadales bacterium]|nr:tRNA (adenosine(37)-N6)-threonylcarbamoyltransferase complex ATPase subunit type 1 TsaE [Candidatus Saccharimonadales bacterium]
MEYKFVCKTTDDTKRLAEEMGKALHGGEVIEFHSDLGGGKTTFMKGLAVGMGVVDVVQSPTFSISQLHKAAHGLELHHFDFYRLDDPGVVRASLVESLAQPNAVVAIEWGETVHDVLGANIISITLTVQDDDARVVTIAVPAVAEHVAKILQNYQQNRTIA